MVLDLHHELHDHRLLVDRGDDLVAAHDDHLLQDRARFERIHKLVASYAWNAALGRVVPYCKEHEKQPWGAKKKQIEEQYERYVPVQFVPDD